MPSCRLCRACSHTAESATVSIMAAPGSDILPRREWRCPSPACCGSRSSLSGEAPGESVEDPSNRLIGETNEQSEYHPCSSKFAYTRDVPFPRVRGRVCDPGAGGIHQCIRAVPASGGRRHSSERVSSVYRSHPGDTAADRLQIREATTLP